MRPQDGAERAGVWAWGTEARFLGTAHQNKAQFLSVRRKPGSLDWSRLSNRSPQKKRGGGNSSKDLNDGEHISVTRKGKALREGKCRKDP